MSSKTKQIILWILTGIIGLFFAFSAYGKLFPAEEHMEMVKALGLDARTMQIIGIVELLALILFIIPRTGVLGTLLLAAYMGGAIATHLEHAMPIMIPCIVQAVIWIVAAFRFPELTSRIMAR
ncbi:MAG: DoxX family protein [Phycisphaerae bacterium]|nr:DoxX family protein [Saprospiraceae bacterium]